MTDLLDLTDAEAVELKQIGIETRQNFDRLRQAYEDSGSASRFPPSPSGAVDSPCYYCDGGRLCKWCIHNPQAKIYD